MLRDIGEWFHRITNPESTTSTIPEEDVIYVWNPVAEPDRARLSGILLVPGAMRGQAAGLDFDNRDANGWPTELEDGALENVFIRNLGPEPHGRSYITGRPLPPLDQV